MFYNWIRINNNLYLWLVFIDALIKTHLSTSRQPCVHTHIMCSWNISVRGYLVAPSCFQQTGWGIYQNVFFTLSVHWSICTYARMDFKVAWGAELPLTLNLRASSQKKKLSKSWFDYQRQRKEWSEFCGGDDNRFRFVGFGQRLV